MTRSGAILTLLCGLPLAGLTLPAGLRAETLADVKTDLGLYAQEIARLRSELAETASEPRTKPSGVPLDRVIAIEGALQRMTAKVEELEYQLNGVARDGAKRLRDLQWRLCELDEACETSSLSELPDPLGGLEVYGPVLPKAELEPVNEQVQLAEQEQTDFDQAMAALDSAAYEKAAKLFATYRQTYPGGPFFPTALVGEGRALAGMGDTREAARRYLRAYSDYPEAQAAPEALFRLGDALAGLGSTEEACVTLAELTERYPETDYVAQAKARRDNLKCS